MKLALTFDDVSIVPSYSNVESRKQVDLTAHFTRNFYIPTPFVGAPMDTVCDANMLERLYTEGAVGCLHRFMTIEEQEKVIFKLRTYLTRVYTTYGKWKTPIVVSIGATGDYLERAERSIECGANVLLIDVAHGDHVHVKNALRELNRLHTRSKFDVIAGNICTADSALRLTEWGADALRVGIGGGSACTTRLKAGVGIPQLTAIMDVVEVATIPVIADGGIRFSGDAAKALAAGADTVMLGGMLSAVEEAPGERITIGSWPHEKTMKLFRGSASASAKGNKQVNVEGASHMTEISGTVAEVISYLTEGVKSAMSYVGAHNLIEFASKAEFMRITSNGVREAHPHGITK